MNTKVRRAIVPSVLQMLCFSRLTPQEDAEMSCLVHSVIVIASYKLFQRKSPITCDVFTPPLRFFDLVGGGRCRREEDALALSVCSN